MKTARQEGKQRGGEKKKKTDEHAEITEKWVREQLRAGKGGPRIKANRNRKLKAPKIFEVWKKKVNNWAISSKESRKKAGRRTRDKH